MARRNVTLEIRAKNALQRGLASAGKQLQAFGQSAARIGKFFAKAFIGMGAAVAGFAVKALHAYAKQEKSERAVAASINAHGENAAAVLPKIKAQAAAIQDQTGVADEATLANMALMRSLGVQTDRLDAAAKGTIALTRAGMGEEAAARAMAAAMQGNFQALTRYIPALRDATSETEKAQIVNDFLNRGYSAQAEELDTVAGQWNLLKGRIGDAWEEVGRAIAQNDGLMTALKGAGDAVKAFGERVAQWVGGGGVTRLMYGFRVFYEYVRLRFQLIGNAAHIAFSAIGDGGETVIRYTSGILAAFFNLATNNFKRMGATATAAWDLVRRPGREAFNALRDAVKDSVDGAIEDFRKLGGAIAGENAVVTKRTESALQQRESYQAASTKRMAGVEEWYTAKVKGESQERVKTSIDEEDLIGAKKAAALAERAALLERQGALEKQIADAEKKAAADKLKGLQDEIRKREDLAKQTVAQFMAERDAGKAAEKALQDDADRAEKLRAKQERGITLSRRDREFLDAFGQIDKARKDIGAGGPMAKQLKEAEKQVAALGEQTRTLKELLREQHDVNGKLDKLLVAQ